MCCNGRADDTHMNENPAVQPVHADPGTAQQRRNRSARCVTRVTDGHVHLLSHYESLHALPLILSTSFEVSRFPISFTLPN
jgi:hypothetical protein